MSSEAKAEIKKQRERKRNFYVNLATISGILLAIEGMAFVHPKFVKVDIPYDLNLVILIWMIRIGIFLLYLSIAMSLTKFINIHVLILYPLNLFFYLAAHMRFHLAVWIIYMLVMLTYLPIVFKFYGRRERFVGILTISIILLSFILSSLGLNIEVINRYIVEDLGFGGFLIILLALIGAGIFAFRKVK